MDTKNNPSKKLSKKKWLFIALAAILVVILVVLAIIFSKDDKDTTSDKPDKTITATSEPTKEPDTVTDTSVETKIESGILSIEDAPEPTLNPEVANDVVDNFDSPPEITAKGHQKTFNDCMENKDYAGAKEVLDSFFAVDDFSIAGDSTYDNYVYYYEKQDLYEESVKYQLDFLEREMGLDNIIEGNTKYQRLLETLKYVQVDDPRLETIQNSVNRWKEIQQLLDTKQVDTAIEKLKGYIENGLQDCVYAYNFLGKAYGLKPDYFKQARTYYIFLLKLTERKPNTLESSFQVVFTEHTFVLFDGYVTDEEQDLIEDTCTSTTLP